MSTVTPLPVRADLLALDDGALAALANRGLVKRASREVDREPPELSADGPVIIAGWGDGVRTELPAGGLDRGSCSCGASGVCRHLIGLVLAYQRAGAEPRSADAEAVPPPAGSVPGNGAGPDESVPAGSAPGGSMPAGSVVGGAAVGEAARRGPEPWSPGVFTDEELVARIGARLVDAARRAERGGYSARIRRGAVPVVELPAATVRFLVPHDLGYVHTDAKAGARDDVIALAVWAFRAADEQQPGTGDCVVDVGGSRAAGKVSGSGLETVVEFAAEVLRAGAVHAGAGLAAMATGQIAALEKSGLRWPLDAVTELAGQLTAYRDRGARYSPDQLADLIAELFARHRAVTVDGGAAARARVLGSEEAAETPLRRVRLDGLGARVTAVDDERRVEIFHGQAASGVVLVSHRQWTADEDGPALSRRRLAGATIAAVASGTLVTESAARSASRSVRLTASRIAKSTVTASTGAWEHLPPGLLVHDYARLAAELDAMPPRPVRARVRADLVRVLAVAAVGEVHYAPGAQRLTVEIRDRSGTTATVVATHATVAPARLDAVAAALTGIRGTPRYVAGSVHRSGGALVIDPYAIAADGPPVVPDLAAPSDFPDGVLPTGQDFAPWGADPAVEGPAVAGPAAEVAEGSVERPAVGEQAAEVAGGPPGEEQSAEATGGPAGEGQPAEAAARVTGGTAGEGQTAEAAARVAGGPAEVLAVADVVDVDPVTEMLVAAVAMAREVLAEAAHSGLAHLPPSYPDRLDRARAGLARTGLHRVAAALGELSARLSPDPGRETAEAWADAYLRVGLAADLL